MSEGATTDLWIYDLQRGSKTRLTNGKGLNSWPVWSPDGLYVIFQSAEGILATRADGAGQPHLLTKSQGLGFPHSFSPDGKWLVFSELSRTGAELRMLPVESNSSGLHVGAPQVYLKASNINLFAAFSPDGRWLAYADAEGGSYEVFVRAFPDNGRQVQISNSGGMMPIWSRNGRDLF